MEERSSPEGKECLVGIKKKNWAYQNVLVEFVPDLIDFMLNDDKIKSITIKKTYLKED